ncbi:hypothetical protein SODALDRAFT_78487 [Sodiomyces alkalinus F11]|uniref:Uncharacterized protein n=1 Tax=Sodiomyces alkalinus (strain CBS 110278 / VKM F-3762 / F11) TaxID=1314773 RepID=A0A3N2PKU0_SODAK|nr:hypothetical protein SODALDRAFT_78487 [Sodiomyces alkalinus F11]ROT35148.1 hypothetical protein SODALDRAFT_78487 [Sodiomyces alkalinus F11]
MTLETAPLLVAHFVVCFPRGQDLAARGLPPTPTTVLILPLLQPLPDKLDTKALCLPDGLRRQVRGSWSSVIVSDYVHVDSRPPYREF